MIEQPSGSGPILILLRHAKAERGDAGMADIDRPLAARGRADAVAAGAWLARHGREPDQVLCSPARRTRQTWAGVGQGLAHDGWTGANGADAPKVRYEPAIYHGMAGDLVGLLRQLPPEVGTLLLIGRNPTMSDLSQRLDPPHAGTEWLRTCELVVHQLDGGWADLRPGGARIRQRHTARAADDSTA